MISLEKILNAPIELVWNAITDKEQLKQWYFDFSDGWNLETGSVFEWSGGDPNGKQWLHRGKMIEIIEGKKIQHTWEYPGYSGMSTVTWELIAIDNKTTKLLFSHVFNIPFDVKEEALRRENFNAGWDHIINKGLPEYLQSKIN